MTFRPVRDSGRSRLSRRDLVRVGSLGLRSRRVRAALSALGISIGIAAIVGVLGISQSSKTGLLTELGQLGNLLTVQPQSTAFGQQNELPTTSEGMVSRIGPVTNVTEIGSISTADEGVAEMLNAIVIGICQKRLRGNAGLVPPPCLRHYEGASRTPNGGLSTPDPSDPRFV